MMTTGGQFIGGIKNDHLRRRSTATMNVSEEAKKAAEKIHEIYGLGIAYTERIETVAKEIERVLFEAAEKGAHAELEGHRIGFTQGRKAGLLEAAEIAEQVLAGTVVAKEIRAKAEGL